MRILCYGDSNTYGYDPRTGSGGRYPAQDRWVDLLAQESGWTVRNRGENGRQIPHFPAALAQAERVFRANASMDLSIIMLGTNDLLQGADARETGMRMEAFLSHIIPCCRRILLIAPPPLQYGEWVTEDPLLRESTRLAAIYTDVAARMGVGFADAGIWGVDLAFDGIHFTEAGNLAFAQGLRATLTGLFPDERD